MPENLTHRLLHLFLSIFDHATLKNFISAVNYIQYKAIPHWKGQKLNFQKKKYFRLRETHKEEKEN